MENVFENEFQVQISRAGYLQSFEQVSVTNNLFLSFTVIRASPKHLSIVVFWLAHKGIRPFFFQAN